MMNDESKLRLQAYLDRELPESEAREVAGWLKQEAEAEALLRELTHASELMKGNEVELKLPETREFYWSKISREIERQSRPAQVRRVTWLASAWVRWLAPLGAAAVVATVLMTAGVFGQGPFGASGRARLSHEVESSDGTIEYHDQKTGITVVWVQGLPTDEN